MTDALDPAKVDELRAYANGEARWITTLYERYDVDTSARVAALRADVALGDAARVSAGAHGIRGASASLGALRVVASCHAIEDAARRGDLVAAGQLVEELARAVEELRSVVPLVLRGA